MPWLISYADDGLQIVDISTPASPKAVASITDGDTDGNGTAFDALNASVSVTTVVIGGKTYALVALHQNMMMDCRLLISAILQHQQQLHPLPMVMLMVMHDL